MIIKKGNNYYVKSKEGKNLGGPYDSKDAAKERLRMVEMFKHFNKKG